MSAFQTQLKWQFLLLQKNNIIRISLIVTLLYAVILFFLRGMENIDKVLITLVLIDPTIIGYFFIALLFYGEIKHQVLPAIFVTSVNIHQFLLTRILALSILGTVCSLGLVLSIKGFEVDFFSYIIGSFSICVMCCLLGLIVIPFASDFLKFALLSFPVFILVINISQLQYLGVIEMEVFKYLFPAQSCIDLLDHAVTGKPISFAYAYTALIILLPLLYSVAFRLFMKKVVLK